MGHLPYESQHREVLVRKKADTSQRYGCYPDARKTDELLSFGIVNIDKPRGPTSHQVSDYVKRIVGVTKAGHSGTLDPKVTGVLPVALGRATKAVQLLLTAGKEYVCLMHLHKQVSETDLHRAVNTFVGKINQLPPVKSAVKRQVREKEIYYFEILESAGQEILFIVGCQAGVYIRKLVHDLGQELGCGAHMAELRRTRVASFNESTLYSLQDLKDAIYYYKEEGNDKFIRKIIQPVENAAVHVAKAWVLDSAIETLCHGSDLKVPGISKVESLIEKGDLVAVLSLKGELVAYGKANMPSGDMLKEKGIAVIIEKVFMLPGTYPKIEKVE